MEDYYIFEEKELVRVGVVCPDCQTETIFNLTGENVATAVKPRMCTGCDKELLPVIPASTVSYNAVTAYKRLLDWDKKLKLRFYFKRDTAKVENLT